MGKFLKVLLYIVIVLVLLVVAAAVVLPLVVDPNDFRDRISEEVRQATGRELVIGGDIGLSVFPWLGLTLNQVSLSQPQGFGDRPFAAVKRAEVRVKLMPLLERRVEADTLRLSGLRLVLIRNADGRNNWEDLAGGGEGTTEAAPGGSAGKGQGLRGLSIGGLEISDADISWDDRQAGQKMEIKQLAVASGAIEPGRPLDLKLSFAFHDSAPALSAHVGLSGTLEEVARGNHYRVTPLHLRLTDIETPEGTRAHLDLEAGLDLDLQAQRARVEPLRLKLGGGGGALPLKDLNLDLRGGILTLDLAQGGVNLSKLALRLQAKGRDLPFDSLDAALGGVLKANWKRGSLALSGLDLKGQARGKDLPGGKLDGHLVTALDMNWKQGTLRMPKVTLDGAGLHLTGTVEGKGLNGRPTFKGRVALAETDLRRHLTTLGVALPPMADPKALTRVTLSSGFEGSPKVVALSGLKLKLDDSRLDGRLRILTAGRHPAYRFSLKLDRIDLDRYLPPPAKNTAKAAGAGHGPAAKVDENAPLFQLEPLRGLDVDGSLGVGHLQVRGLKFDGIHLKVKGADGRIGLTDRIDGLYKGALKGSARIDASGRQARLALKQDMRGVRAEPLLKDLLQEDRLSGQAQMHLDLSTRGQSLAAIKRGLNGRLGARFSDGEIRGFNLARTLREAAARLRGRTLPPEKARPKTDFTELKVDARVVNGVVRDDLSAKSPLFRVTGKGSVDLVNMTLNYKLKPVLVASLKGEGGKDLNRLKGVPIPIEFKGPLAKPHWSVNIAEALTASQKERLKKKASQELKKILPKEIQQQLPGGLDKQLDGAFKGLFN